MTPPEDTAAMDQASTQLLLTSIARLETKMDAILLRGEDHETRLRLLEQRIWQFVGASVLMTFVLIKMPFLSQLASEVLGP